MGLPAIMSFPDMIVLAATVYLAVISIVLFLLTQEGEDTTSTLERLIALTPAMRYLRFFTQIFAVKLGIEVILFILKLIEGLQTETLPTNIIISACAEICFGSILVILLFFFAPLTLYGLDRFVRTLSRTLTSESTIDA